MANGTIITSITDALAVCSNIIESANNEVVYLSPPSLLVLGSQFGLRENIKKLIRKEVSVRGIADFSYQYIEEMRELLDIGIDTRHVSQYQGIFMLVADRRESISSMSIDIESLSIDTPLVALWSDDSTYAEYLLSTFKLAWEQAIPAVQRIEELLKEGPPNV
ncbi:MAG TPA: hypothetical protein VEG44_00055 [Candidatus Acidoferrales bacterium]|nr:hypothetical protein [Candidatus Acidoferrales bacterium]